MPRIEFESMAETMKRVKDSADLRQYCAEHLTAKGRTFVCPKCGSGEGPNGTPAFSIQADGKRWKCFSCETGGDIFDLCGIVEGLEDNRREQVEQVARWAGVSGRGTSYPARETRDEHAEERTHEAVTDEYAEGREQVRGYLAKCCERLLRPDPTYGVVWVDAEAGAYLEARGFSAVTAGLCGFGYDPDAGGAQDAEGKWCRRGRVTLPWPVYRDDGNLFPWYYTSRAIDPAASSGKYHKPTDKQVGGQPDIDVTALESVGVLFVTEGLMDAWGVVAALDSREHGWPVPLGGVGNAQKVATQIADRRYRGVVVLMLDNDERGKEASGKMADILTSRGVKWVEWPWSVGEHDPADSWRDTGGAFGSFAESVRGWAEGVAEAAWMDRVRAEASEKVRASLTDPVDVLMRVYDGTAALDPVRTHIRALDDILGGGMMAGSLIVIGASASSGKSTLTLQIANEVAESGTPVLFVTVEMTPEELVSKSIAWASSRLTGIKSGTGAITALGMRSRLERSHWTLEQNQHMREACDWYTERIAPNIRFMHDGKRPTVEGIRQMAELMAAEYGKPPFVAVDYLQLLAPPEGADGRDVRLSVDDNVTALRDMAQGLGTPVWVVSSVGRGAYYGSVDMSSYKESSGIEFGADVALGLQPRDMADTATGRSEAVMRAKGKEREAEEREKDVRNVEVVVLKNRYGRVRPSHGIPLTYFCCVDRFLEVAPTP